ncbi:hypothetical protein ALC60_11884 [Trachymyrmex zeteki]|uniref:Uncharacterized protein n=1 Tax=Mycetomoellerius zeteki TaxID=64791 RepID=A0A151WLR5_9HYME|nr:hypothetical protein ALC60_11884 [Trachymyrmex zeteki]
MARSFAQKLRDVKHVIVGRFDLSSYYTTTVNPSLLEELGYFPTDIQRGLVNGRILHASKTITRKYFRVTVIFYHCQIHETRRKLCGCHSRPQLKRCNDPERNRSVVTSFGALPPRSLSPPSPPPASSGPAFHRALVQFALMVPGGSRERIVVCRDALPNGSHVPR